MNPFGLRKIPMGINQDSNSCWLAATLQAIVACPHLVLTILNRENYSSERIEKEKKILYLEKLSEMDKLIRAEVAIISLKYPKELYEKDKSERKGTIILKKYPRDTNLMESDFDMFKPGGEWWITETTFKTFITLMELDILKLIQILERYLDSDISLEELIEKKIIDLPLEKLLYYYNIFKGRRADRMPFFWRSLSFNKLLKLYLSALIDNDNPSLCLNPQILRKDIHDSMVKASLLLDSEFKFEFVDRVLLNTSNPMIFLFIMFENFRYTTYPNSGVLPLLPAEIFSRGTSILLPTDITKFQSINQMVNSGEIVFDEQIRQNNDKYGRSDDDYNLYDFLIITNSAISTRHDAPILYSQGATHNFVTEQEIRVFGVRYELCSVIIHYGGSHYITLTKIGEFNDSRVTQDPTLLQKFCETSKHVEQTSMGPKNHPGYIWFYQKMDIPATVDAIQFYVIKDGYQELLVECGSSPSVSHSTSAWYNKVDINGRTVLSKFMDQFSDYSISELIETKYPEPQSYLSDTSTPINRREYLEKILAESNLLEGSKEPSFVSLARSYLSEPRREEMPSFRAEMPSFRAEMPSFRAEMPSVSSSKLSNPYEIYECFRGQTIADLIHNQFIGDIIKNHIGSNSSINMTDDAYNYLKSLKGIFFIKIQKRIKENYNSENAKFFCTSSGAVASGARTTYFEPKSVAVESLDVHDDWLEGKIGGMSYRDLFYDEMIDKTIFKMSIPQFIQTYKNDTSVYGQVAKQIEDAKSSSKPTGAAQSSSPKDNEYWTNKSNIKQQIIALAGADASKLEFSLSPFDLLDKLPEYGLGEEKTAAIGAILADTLNGGFSNYKKYLKYKNKYLQLKRMEKNQTKHFS